MAQTVDKLAATDEPNFPRQAAPPKAMQGPYVISQEPTPDVLPGPAQSALEERLDHAKWRASAFLVPTKQLFGKLYRNAQDRAVETLTNLASVSGDLIRSARTRAEQIKKEHPLQLLAAVGGTALVLGIVARAGGHVVMHHNAKNEPSLGAILREMKEELKEFVQTRIEMFRTELGAKIKNLKVAVPLAAVGALLLGTAYLLFTMALVGLVVALFRDNPYRWFFAFAAVGALWTLLGGVAGYFAKREFELKELLPRKTIEVLKGDNLWIQAEAKNQI